MIQITNINTTSNDQSSSVKLCLNGMPHDPIPLENATSKIIDWRIVGQNSRREMSVTEFSKEAGISRQAVIKMIIGGRLDAKKIGEQYIIQQEELVRYLQIE